MYGQTLKRLRIVASGLMLCLLVAVMVFGTFGGAVAQTTVDGDITNAIHFAYPQETRSWDAAGLMWVIYIDNNGGVDTLYFQNSDDYGATWGNKTAITSVTVEAGCYGCFYDYNNDYVHIAYNDNFGNGYYRRGECNSDGTITWSAAWQDLGLFQWLNGITVNTDGYAFLARTGYVYKNANLDGTWLTDWSKQVAISGAAKLVSLTDGKIAMIYRNTAGAGYTPVIRCWRGGDQDDWTAAAAGSKPMEALVYMSAVAQDDDIHIAFLEDVSYDIVYTKYQYSTNSFSTTAELYTGATSTSAPAIQRIIDNNDLLVYWENDPINDHIFYAHYDTSDSTWYSYTDWVNEAVIDGLPANGYYLACHYTCTTHTAGLFYIAGAAILKYDGVEFPTEVITLPATNINTTSASIRGEILGIGTGTPVWRGFLWGTDPNLITYTSVGEAGSFGMGVYSQTLNGLDSDSIYFYEAYVIDDLANVYEGNITGFLTLQSSWAPPDDPDDPDIVPPIPDEPGGWIDNSKTYDSWPFSDLVNTFADNISRSFVWFAIMVIGVCGIGLIVTGATKHLGITFLVMGVCLGLFIAGGYLDWWIMLPYLLVGIALITKEQQWGW